MKRLFAIAFFLAITGGFIRGQASLSRPNDIGSAADKAAIQKIVNDWQQTWDRFDASMLQDDYTDDADWLNAFGVRLKGSQAILDFMSKVVKRPNVQDRHTTWNEPAIRFLRPDVALASRDYKTVGHRTLNGKEMPQRNTHSNWLLTKDAGKWHIASQVISDDNSAQ